VRGVCEKPRIKCSDCPNQRWLPVTDEIVRQHLSGEDVQGRPFVMGVYPMLPDESCYFLAVDLDGEGWREDALALVIELDGAQHLADEEAWRRDRRKDALLQRHGYFILRFLATDVAKHLGEVLDSIQATIAFLERK